MKKLTISSAIALAALVTLPLLAQDNPKLSDPEVASVAVTANKVDISYADIAREKSKNADILKFADTMTKDHNAVLKQAGDLVKKLGVTPQDNAVSKKLNADAEKTRSELRAKKTEKEFNKAYIDNEVAYHKAVIGAVEGLLIPETDNAELKALLQAILPALRTHLEHAEMVQKMF